MKPPIPSANHEKELEAYLASVSDAPQACIPFAVTGPKVEQSFKTWLDGLSLVPGDLKTTAKFNKADAAYVPFWVVSAQAHAAYKGERGDHYKDAEEQTAPNGETKTREVTRTDWSPAQGEVRHSFQDIVVCAVNGLDERQLALITPDVRRLSAYDAPQASQGKPDRAAVGGREAFARARASMEAHLKSLAEKDIGGNERKVSKLEPRFLNPVVKLVLVPVYRGSFHYGGKDYEFLMHGSTGEVHGDHPVSAGKIALVVGAVLLVFALIVGGVYWFVVRPALEQQNAPTKVNK
jgi:hypothetical protein